MITVQTLGDNLRRKYKGSGRKTQGRVTPGMTQGRVHRGSRKTFPAYYRGSSRAGPGPKFFTNPAGPKTNKMKMKGNLEGQLSKYKKMNIYEAGFNPGP